MCKPRNAADFIRYSILWSTFGATKDKFPGRSACPCRTVLSYSTCSRTGLLVDRQGIRGREIVRFLKKESNLAQPREYVCSVGTQECGSVLEEPRIECIVQYSYHAHARQALVHVACSSPRARLGTQHLQSTNWNGAKVTARTGPASRKTRETSGALFLCALLRRFLRERRAFCIDSACVKSRAHSVRESPLSVCAGNIVSPDNREKGLAQ